MRQLTDSEREQMETPLREYWVKRDGLLPSEERAFVAGFTAGLECQQAERDALRAEVERLRAEMELLQINRS